MFQIFVGFILHFWEVQGALVRNRKKPFVPFFAPLFMKNRRPVLIKLPLL